MPHTIFRTLWMTMALAFAAICWPPAAHAQSAAAEASAKEKLLASQEWKQIYADFQAWLGRQAIYRKEDIARINANLAAQIEAMPAGEVQGFIDQWQARVELLKGKEFQDVQDWLGQNLSLMADGFRRRNLKEAGLEDLSKLSAAELEDAFLRIRAARLNGRQRHASVDRLSQDRVASARQARTAAEQARQAARPSTQPGFATHTSPYRPPKFNPPPPERRQFFVTPGGRIIFDLPF